MGNHTEAKNAFNIAISALDFVPKLAPEKKESMIRDINALMAEAKSTSQRYLTFPWKFWLILLEIWQKLTRNPKFLLIWLITDDFFGLNLLITIISHQLRICLKTESSWNYSINNSIQLSQFIFLMSIGFFSSIST